MRRKLFVQSVVPAVFTASTWTPASLSNLLGWWSTDVNSTVLNLSSAPAVNGDPVLQWNDRSSNGNNVFGGHVSNTNPVYNTGILNGLPGITTDFTNISYFLGTAGAFALGGTKASVYAVAKNLSNGTNSRLVSFLGSGDTEDFAFPGSFALLTGPGSGNDITTVRNSNNVGTTTIGSANFNRIYAVFDTALCTVYVNGASSSGATTGTWGNPGRLAIGLDATTGGGQGSWILCEIFIQANTPSPSDLTSIDSYLTGKWGV